MIRYGGSNLLYFFILRWFLFICAFLFTTYVEYFVLTALMPLTIFVVIIKAWTFCSSFIHLLGCQPCRLRWVRRRNIILFRGVWDSASSSRRQIFTFNLPCEHESFSKEVGLKRRTSCSILSSKVPIKRSNNLSSSMSSNLRMNFWNCWMCSIIGPFFLRFINWVMMELLLTSWWYDINSSIKMDQDIMVFFLCSHSCWYHTNYWGSKYRDAIVTFCKFGTWCISKNCSIWNIHVMGSLPSNFLMSILGSWIPRGDHPWLIPSLESNPLGVGLLMEGWSTWALYLSSWVPWATSSTLGRFASEFCMNLTICYTILFSICPVLFCIFIPFSSTWPILSSILSILSILLSILPVLFTIISSKLNNSSVLIGPLNRSSNLDTLKDMSSLSSWVDINESSGDLVESWVLPPPLTMWNDKKINLLSLSQLWNHPK